MHSIYFMMFYLLNSYKLLEMRIKITAISVFFFAVSQCAFAQQTLSVNQVTGDHSVFSGIKSTTGKTLNYDEIQGSPYFDSKFYDAKVAENYENILVRYNSYKDEIEFQKGNVVQVLPKDSKFSKIEIISPKHTIMLFEDEKENNGYFFELVSGKNSLYKKLVTKFIDVVPAANSYAAERPASFRKLDPSFYLNTGKGLIKIKNQKSVTDGIPDSKDKLETFIKSNKIKFDKEEDLIKLVTFLNQN